MIHSFLTAHADFLFWLGVVVETVGSLWFLFDSYRCDVSLARWTLLFPPLALFLVFRYPEECLKSFLVCAAGLVILGVGEAYSPPGKTSIWSVPSAMESPGGE